MSEVIKRRAAAVATQLSNTPLYEDRRELLVKSLQFTADEAEERTRQEAYAALCSRCAKGDVPTFYDSPSIVGTYRHFEVVPCFADALRKRWSE